MKNSNSTLINLFNQGLGARQIAKKLGVKHHATIGKRLHRLGCIRKPNQHLVQNISCLVKSVNSKCFSKAAELLAQYWFVSHGYEVSKPDSSAPYDLLVNLNGEFKRIQVKSSITKNPSENYIFTLVRSRHNASRTKKTTYRKEDTDFFMLIDLQENIWLIPIEEVKTKTVVPSLVFPGCKIRPLGEMADAEDLDNESLRSKP